MGRWEYFSRLRDFGLLGKGLGLAWGLYGFLAAARDEAVPEPLQGQYHMPALIAHALSISFSWWLVVALIIALIWLFESSYRLADKQEKEISRLGLVIENRIARQKGVDALWDARAKGIKLREEAITEVQLPSWAAKWEKWKTEVLEAAVQINPNLNRYLEYLDQCRPIPKGLPILNEDHLRYITAGTEMLLRMQEFLEKEIK